MPGFKRRLAVLSVTAAVLASACSGSVGSGGGSSHISRTFVYAASAEVMSDGWDPATEYQNGIIAMSEMYETLTRYNAASHRVEPLLATSWSHSRNGLTWTFKLRQNVHFHTGRLLTAQAAKDSILRTKKLNGGAAYIWAAVQHISTPDSRTLVFHLKYPAPLDLQASADYSAYLYDTKAGGNEPLAKWLNAGHDAGTGPYTVQTWNRGQETELVLRGFPDYWGGWSGAHYKHVVFRVVPQATTAALLLQSGDVNFVEQMNPAQWASFKGNPQVRLITKPSWLNYFGELNTRMLSRTVREAISYSIDYRGIIAALKGAATPSSGVVPPGLFGHFTNLPVYTYDPSRATQLLKGAGYGPGGRPLNLTLTFTQGDPYEQIATTIMKSDLARLNINLDIQSLAYPAQTGKARSSDPAEHQAIYVDDWWPDFADPYSWFLGIFHSEQHPYFNLSYYSNPRVDRMMSHVEQLEATDPASALNLYRRMQVIILRDAPVLFLWNANYQYAVTRTFSGLRVNPAYPNVVFAYNLKPLPS